MKELVDVDLHGAPYGYTPMGDDNEEMEGFRFWKTGYWKETLQDRPYHIRSELSMRNRGSSSPFSSVRSTLWIWHGSDK